ncbi:MAG: glycerophosphodiester phosphodiesterase family protein [Christensenellales bacterium]|jgi:glycerophosphoryl diester phosphodiesterase|nr:hypothetical protein [Clostridiales bacterium]
MMDTIKLNLKGVKMVAHRGASGLERENTCAAFVAAGNRSYSGIEADVHRTKDGQFIVVHDDDLLRVAGVNWVVEETAFERLRSVYLSDLGGTVRKDLFLPSLEEYVTICKRYQKDCVLEIKNHIEEEDINRLVNNVRELGWLERTIFISFDLDNLIAVRKLLPNQPIQFLTDKMDQKVLDILNKYRFDLDVKYTGISQSQIKRLRSQGINVNVWTVDDPQVAKTMAGYGVNYITTNILE